MLLKKKTIYLQQALRVIRWPSCFKCLKRWWRRKLWINAYFISVLAISVLIIVSVLVTGPARGLVVSNGVTRGLSEGKNLIERGPLATVGWPLTNTQKKAWEMILNPDVDGYILKPYIIGNIPKNAKKQQPTENQKNTKTTILAKCGPVFACSLPGGNSPHCSTVSYATGSKCVCFGAGRSGVRLSAELS